jgi:2-polyprenyl-3-methyl-5-hydroxy-6-metoxy-1,4-benzoquinol methylase
MLTPKRIYVQEMLDAGCGTDLDVAQNLDDLRRINRNLRGTGAVLKALSESLDGKKVNHVSLLDVGTGSADIPDAVVNWCTSRGIEPCVVALDVSERNLKVAKNVLGINPEVALVQADAQHTPFPDGSFDFVTASLFLHHFREDEIVDLLRDFARIARRAIIINDLVRNLVPYYFIRLLGPILMTSFLTRNDGPVSVLRGFTADELRDLAHRAGIRSYRVERRFPYRLLLVSE